MLFWMAIQNMFLLKENYSLKNLCTFHIGGRAKYYIQVKSSTDLIETFQFIKSKNLKYFILGNGSNILFDDDGYDGVIIHNDLCEIVRNENEICVQSGVLLKELLNFAQVHNLGGLEFAAGIPGTVGGAIYMNAGAENENISKYLKKVWFYAFDNDLKEYDIDDLTFGYRTSSFQKMSGFLFKAQFFLSPFCDKEKIRAYLIKRKSTQPIEAYSAGSVFKNPPSNYAGKLIEECNLKGVKIGGAKISEKHANFIINEKNANSKDVLALIALIKKSVFEKHNIVLNEEIIFLPK